ncbi:MAG: DUF5615 family PIN-like protein [Candidatus Limnocylindria bacterium]
MARRGGAQRCAGDRYPGGRLHGASQRLGARCGGDALRGAEDARVLDLAAAEGRALVTENARDFLPLHDANRSDDAVRDRVMWL